MGLGGAALELGVELAADVPGVIAELNHLDELAIRRQAAQHHARGDESLAVGVVDLEAVAVALLDLGRLVDRRGAGASTSWHGYEPSRMVAPLSTTFLCCSISVMT